MDDIAKTKSLPLTFEELSVLISVLNNPATVIPFTMSRVAFVIGNKINSLLQELKEADSAVRTTGS